MKKVFWFFFQKRTASLLMANDTSHGAPEPFFFRSTGHIDMTTFKYALGLGLLVAVPAFADTVQYQAKMEGGSEVPPTASTGTGSAEATLDTATRKLTWTVTWQGLNGAATMAHFHGPAPAGVNAGVAVPLGMKPVSPIKGSATLTAEQMTELQAGNWYVNVHTAQFPKGAIRGQMAPAK
jgi:hypothetical protein